MPNFINNDETNRQPGQPVSGWMFDGQNVKPRKRYSLPLLQREVESLLLEAQRQSSHTTTFREVFGLMHPSLGRSRLQ